MKSFILFLSTCGIALSHYTGTPNRTRYKRGAVGALEIVTNDAERIHADVKSDTADTTDKPCPNANDLPAPIEMGTVFQVTPPKDAVYEVKSLRKSWPLTNRLDLVRSITRVVTLAILVLSAAIEFYPLIQHVYYLSYM